MTNFLNKIKDVLSKPPNVDDLKTVLLKSKKAMTPENMAAAKKDMTEILSKTVGMNPVEKAKYYKTVITELTKKSGLKDQD